VPSRGLSHALRSGIMRTVEKGNSYSSSSGRRSRNAIVSFPDRDTARRGSLLRLPPLAFEPLVAPDAWPVAASASRLWWLALLATALAIVAPLLATELPPLLDYPNHLARMEVLAHGAGDPILSRMYATQWRILPNIAMDAIMPAMLDLMPLNVAGRCVIALALLLPFLGSVFLHASLFHRRSFWPLSAALVVYNNVLFLGFLNFLIGLGLALVGAALWVRTLQRPIIRLAMASLFAIIIFFCHLIALACYGFLLVALEIALATEARPGERRITLPHPSRLIGVALPFVIPTFLYLHAPLAAASAGFYWAPVEKVEGVFAGFTTYSFILDGAALVFAIGTIVWCWRTARLSVARALLIAVVALCLLYPFTPFATKGTGFIDQRLPPLASFLLLAGTLPIGLSRRQRVIVSFGMIAIVSMRLVNIASVWYRHSDDVAAFRRVIAPIEPGSRVLAVMVTAHDVPDFYDGQPTSRFFLLGHPALGRAVIMHLPALALIERRAFWPLLFTASTKQPLKVLAPYSNIAVNEGVVPSYTWLSAGPGLALPYDAPYLANWKSNFDYVIVLYAGKLPDATHLRPDVLLPLVITDVAALYRITHVAPVSERKILRADQIAHVDDAATAGPVGMTPNASR
jgi:hypothetical protein